MYLFPRFIIFSSKVLKSSASQLKQSQDEISAKKTLISQLDQPKMKIAKLENYFEQHFEKKPIIDQNNDLIFIESPKRKSSNQFVKNNKPKTEDVIILDDDDDYKRDKQANLVECPMCFVKVNQELINTHVNTHF